MLAVTVTSEYYIAEHWVRDACHRYWPYLISGTAVIALAIQCHQGNGGPPNTMQICVGEYCLVHQLSRAEGVPRLLREFLLLPEVTYVGIHNPNYRILLFNSRHAVEVPGDLYYLRSFLIPKLACANLTTIVHVCLGYTAVTWTPQIMSSDWGAVTLSDEQALAASIQARCAFVIGRNFEVWRHRP